MADGVNYAFNEFLHFGSEQGIFISLLFIGILIYALFLNDKPNLVNWQKVILLGAKGSLVAQIVAFLFSYPLRSAPSLAMFFISLAIIASNKIPLGKIEITQKIKRFLLVIFLKRLNYKFFKIKGLLELSHCASSSASLFHFFED